jgi:hypothetical protein
MSQTRAQWQDNAGQWQYHLDQINSSDSLDVKQKAEVQGGIAKLREVFDDNWLSMAMRIQHPLVSSILNYAPTSYLSLADLGRKLNLLKEVPSFKELTVRLKNGEQYAGAEAELDAAYKLISSGLSIKELFPKVGKGKADIVVLIDGEEIYCEVATLQDSIKSARASETFQSLTIPFTFRQDAIIQCQIHKILSKPHINELKMKIENALSIVQDTGEPAYINEPGIIDYLVVPRNKEGQLQELVNKFGMKREVSGPPIPIDDERRVENKIWQEVNQLPKDKPGVIVIYANLIYFGEAKQYYNNLAYQIDEAIFDQHNVLLGIVISKVGSSEPGFLIEEDNYVLAMKEVHDILRESVLIIKNRYSDFKAKVEINKKVISAFISPL